MIPLYGFLCVGRAGGGVSSDPIRQSQAECEQCDGGEWSRPVLGKSQVFLPIITIITPLSPQLVRLDLQLAAVMGLRHRSAARRRGKSEQGADWQLSLDSLTGRLTLKLPPSDSRLSAKLEGWPALNMRSVVSQYWRIRS